MFTYENCPKIKAYNKNIYEVSKIATDIIKYVRTKYHHPHTDNVLYHDKLM